MKRLALLLLCGVAAASAQESRITRAAMLRSERAIISLRPGTIVDVLGRDGEKLTVRYNQHTGTIPANSFDVVPEVGEGKDDSKALVAAAPAPAAAPAKKAGSGYVNAVNKTKDNTAKHGQNNAQQTNEVLASAD
jgi:hypothetical protein